jgi:hypothetical protein
VVIQSKGREGGGGKEERVFEEEENMFKAKATMSLTT